MEWIYTTDRLPNRFKIVHIKSSSNEFIGRRSTFTHKWIVKSGLKIRITENDKWR